MKRSILFLTMAMLFTNAIAADLFMSNNQKMVSDALSKAFFVIETPYNIQDSTGVAYGRNHTFFNRSYTLGLHAKEGLAIHAKALYPWIGDADFDKYKHAYTPVLRTSCIRELDGTVDSLLLDTTVWKKQCLGDVSYYLSKQNASLKHGVQLDTTFVGEGWMVWITANTQMSKMDSTTKTHYLVYRKSFDLTQKDTCAIGALPFSADEYVWGGAWFIPHFDGMGKIDFLLAGICFKNGDDWFLSRSYLEEITKEIIPLDLTTDTKSTDETIDTVLEKIDEPAKPVKPTRKVKKTKKQKL